MMMMTSASPVRGRRGFDAGRAQRATGSSTTIAKFCSTYVGSEAINRMFSILSRARGWAARCHLICATCSIGLAGAAAAGRRIRR